MAGPEGGVIRLAGKQGRQEVGRIPDGGAVGDLLPQPVHGVLLPGAPGVEGGPHGHGEAAVIGENRLTVRQAQGLLEPAAQALAVVEGPA